MERVILSSVIERPVGEVFAFCTDFRNDALWMPGVLEARQASPGPVAVGSVVTHLCSSRGRTVELTYVVAELELERRLGVKSLSAPFPTEWTVGFEGHEGSTQLKFTGVVHARGLAMLAAPSLEVAFQGRARRGLSSLKAVLEARR